MLLLLNLLKSYWKQLAIAVIFLAAAFTAYNHVYQRGYMAAEATYQKQIATYQEQVAKRIDNVEKLSTTLVEQSNTNAQTLSKDLSVILTTVKNKPLYKIENGKCSPSVDFIDSYNAVILRGNQK
jgi:Tfp pilus assembly protein PilE